MEENELIKIYADLNSGNIYSYKDIKELYLHLYIIKKYLNIDIFNEDGTLMSNTMDAIMVKIKRKERMDKLKTIFN